MTFLSFVATIVSRLQLSIVIRISPKRKMERKLREIELDIFVLVKVVGAATVCFFPFLLLFSVVDDAIPILEWSSSSLSLHG